MLNKVFIIIPTLNEEKNICDVLSKLLLEYKNIIVVDDGSSDKTIEIVSKFPVILLKHFINRGQGAALQTGNEYAIKNGADIIIHFDGDGQFQIEDIDSFIKTLQSEKYDIVFGSRFMGKKSNLPKIKKYIILPIGKIVNKIFFNINTTDPQSGFRAMTKDTAIKINIEQDKMAHCSEILHKAFKYKLRIKEIPITVKYSRFGQSFGGGLEIVKDLIINKISK